MSDDDNQYDQYDVDDFDDYGTFEKKRFGIFDILGFQVTILLMILSAQFLFCLGMFFLSYRLLQGN